MERKPHACSMCSSSFDRPSKLQQHILLHNNVREHKCIVEGCDRAYSSPSHLKRHIKSSHTAVPKNTDRFRCPTCLKPFANRQNQKRHIRIVHIEAQKYPCLHCSLSFKDEELLMSHMYVHAGVELDLKPHPCPYEGCGLSFDRPYKLQQHILRHNNVRVYKCNEVGCDRAYGSKSHLNRHVRSVHSADARYNNHFGCPSCSKPFANRQNLVRHIKLVHMESENFPCLQCPESFKRKHLLTSHMYIHTGVKAFKCDMCTELFITHYEKKRHMRIHSKYTCEDCFVEFNLWSKYQDHRKNEHLNKEFICDHCQRKFTRRLHIVRHMRFHFLKTFKQCVYCCPYEDCTKTYTRKNNLKAHLKTKHLGQTFDCTICSAKLTTKASLIRHLAHHNRPPSRKPPKTKETGRKPRKDKGVPQSSTAMQILGIPKEALELILRENPQNGLIKKEGLYSTTPVETKSELSNS